MSAFVYVSKYSSTYYKMLAIINFIKNFFSGITGNYKLKIIRIKKMDDIIANEFAKEIYKKDLYLLPIYIKIGSIKKDSRTVLNMFGFRVTGDRIGNYYVVRKIRDITIEFSNVSYGFLNMEAFKFSVTCPYGDKKIFNTIIGDRVSYIESPVVKNLFDYYKI